MATDSLVAVNQQILKAIDGMIRSLKHIEDSEIAAASLNGKEINELNDFANRHNEYLLNHPPYKKLVELTAASGITEQNRRLIAAKLIKQEYGPLLELRKQVEDELEERDAAVAGEKAELAKEFEFEVKDHKGDTGAELTLIGSKKPTHVYFITKFKGEAERQGFKTALGTNVSNSLGFRKLLIDDFEERKYTNSDEYHKPEGGIYFVCKNNAIKSTYGDLEVHRAIDPPGVDFGTWVDRTRLEVFANKHLAELFPRQQQAFGVIKKDAQAIKLAEQRVAEQLEQEKGLKDAVEKKLKVEVKEFDEIHGGKIPKKYKNLVKELSSNKYLRTVVERARNSTDPNDPNFKDKPIEILKQDIEQKIPQDQIEIELKGLLLKELIPKLEKELNALATRKPKSLIADTLKEAFDEFRKLTAAGKTDLAVYNDDREAKALKQKIEYVRNLIVSSPLTRQERLKAAGFFNVRIVKPMVDGYSKIGFTADQVTRVIPALRDVTSEELSRYK